MTVVYIIVAVLAVIFLLINTSAVIFAKTDADGTYRVKVKWLMLTVFALPKANENKRYKDKQKTSEKTAGKKKKQKKNNDKPKRKLKIQSISALKGFIGGVCDWLTEVFGGLINTVKVKKLHVLITVAGKDSAKTAVQYGQISAVTSNTLSRLDTLMKLHDTCVLVEPDFLGSKTTVILDAKIKVRIGSVLIVILKNLTKGMNFYEQAMGILFSQIEEKGNENNE